MFYSHQILNSPASGLATVWLLATLGPTCQLRKVNRKAILDVNVPKACNTIINPDAPMALRLQSNLLYGVSRVYSKQYGYMLSDTQLAQANMRTLLKAVRTSALDATAGQARPGQLMIEDDPNFVPEFPMSHIPMGYPSLDYSTDGSPRHSSIFSVKNHRSPSSPSSTGIDVAALEIPSMSADLLSLSESGGFQPLSDKNALVHGSQTLDRLLEDDGDGFNFDPGFTFDADGNIIDDLQAQRLTRIGSRGRSPSGASDQLRRELTASITGFDDELPTLAEDHFHRDDDPARPPTDLLGGRKDDAHDVSQSTDQDSASDYFEAHQRKRKVRQKTRTLIIDQTTELRNAELANWRDNYLENMRHAREAKQNRRVPAQAKSNAAFWVVQNGIGGIGLETVLKEPFCDYAGDRLMEKLLGRTLKPGRKRKHVEADGQNRGSDRQRQRLGDADIILMNDDIAELGLNDAVELGRDAPTPLNDEPTFPWNNTTSLLGSHRGSSIGLGKAGPSSVASIPSSILGGPPSGAANAPNPGRVGRKASVSPLARRGGAFASTGGPHIQFLSGRESPVSLHMDDDLLEDYPMLGNDGDESFQLHGPGAAVSTQTAAQSQWLKATLDREAANFLEFARAKMDGNENRARLGSDHGTREIQFDQLLPPEKHSHVVAAQGLLHLLTLATKDVIKVKQRDALSYGEITLALVE